MLIPRTVLATLLFSLLSISASAITVGEIESDINSILARPAVANNTWTIGIEDQAGSVIYYTRNAATPMRPASNTKLFTAAGAFGILGVNHIYQKQTIQAYCTAMNKSSDNVMADDLLKYIGSVVYGRKSATFAKGSQAVFEWCTAAGIDLTGARMDDGSGLDYDNRFSAYQMEDLCRYMDINYPSFDDTLPIGCVDGTLSSRFCGTDGAGAVVAKTGTLPNGQTVSLSGYINNPYDGKRYLFSFIANSATDVTATRIAIDDAVLVMCQGGIPDSSGGSTGTTVIVDNAEAGFAASTNWITSSATPGYYGSDYRYRTTEAVNDPATWTASLPASGTYTVYARWNSGTNRSTTAPYIISHANGTSTVYVNQQSNGGTWQVLGTYTFNAGATNVQLSSWTTAGFVVIADAVKFVAP